MMKKLKLDKTRISKLTNLNSIIGGTGTVQDSQTNPLTTEGPDTNGQPDGRGPLTSHTGTHTTVPVSEPLTQKNTATKNGPITTSKLC